MVKIVEVEISPDDPLGRWRSGSCEPWTVSVLCSLIQAKAPLTLLETGTYLGLTTLKMAEAMPEEAVLHTVDNMCSNGIVPTLVLKNQRIKFHQADIMDWLEAYSGPPIDLAFVDDDHNPQHVFDEIKLLLPKMAPDGLICGHDVHGIYSLHKIFTHFGGTSLKFPLLHAAGGLGLIQL